MTAPNGAKLLATLIDLLSEQNGVKITYQIKNKGEQK